MVINVSAIAEVPSLQSNQVADFTDNKELHDEVQS